MDLFYYYGLSATIRHEQLLVDQVGHFILKWSQVLIHLLYIQFQHLSAHGGARLVGRQLLGQSGVDEWRRLPRHCRVLRTDLLLAGQGDTPSGNEDREEDGSAGVHQLCLLGTHRILREHCFGGIAVD